MVKEVSLFFVILFFVLLVNLFIISFDLLYPEQSLLYVANQAIHSLAHLFNIDVQPKVLHFKVPFLRALGHFLIRQFPRTLLGWHNTKGLIFINLLFLALNGYLLIKLYRLFFLDMKVGGASCIDFIKNKGLSA